MASLKTSLKIDDLVAASKRNMNTNIDVSDVISVVWPNLHFSTKKDIEH